ncbi:MAG: class A beta-lactamase [Alistipes sp.]|nr:class A beta-lactamase [Alistipes senegalensis]MCM1250667.1 class A beta-lactamase [Alistipes sp.]
MFRTFLLLLCCGAAACTTRTFRQAEPRAALERDLQAMIDSVPARVGIAAVFGDGDTLLLGNRPDYPMASVYKFHQALALLDSLDRAGLTPDLRLEVGRSDLLPDTWSPLRDARPEGRYSLPVSELLRYSVAQSDNNVCDLLFRFMGGPRNVERYLRSLGLDDTTIGADEAAMHRDPSLQYANTASPLDAVRLLERFRRGELLSPAAGDLLLKIMLETVTGPDKLRGLLPPDVRVAHKTGSGLRDARGVVAADNDIGIVLPPDGRAYSVAVFIADSPASDRADAALIARISRRIYDYRTARSTDKKQSSSRRGAGHGSCRCGS